VNRLKAAKLLSIPPAFDEHLAAVLVSNFGTTQPSTAPEVSAERARRFIHELNHAGLLIRGNGWFRVNESLRTQLSAELRRDDFGLYVDVVASCVAHMSNGSKNVLIAAAGSHGAEIVLSILRMEAGSAAEEFGAFDDLVNNLNQSSQRGRYGDASAAARLVDDLPLTEDRGRQRAFLTGLVLWNDDRKTEAIVHLEKVWKGPPRDLAFAIAAHLMAAHHQAQGNAGEALLYATESRDTLREIGDSRGLAMVLTTLGRIERDLVERDPQAAEIGMNPIATLQEAADLALGIGNPVQAGLALAYIAGVQQHDEDYEEALATALEARALVPDRNPVLLQIIPLLVSLYRTLGRFDEALVASDEGSTIARTLGDRRHQAILLNTQASLERQIGQLADSQKHALASVELGRALGNSKHVSRALNTLARVLTEVATDRESLAKARSAAEESRSILTSLQDVRGLRMIERTIGLIDKRHATLEA
jgi:tetratricopeptide (TPR) repeat protein